MIEVVFTTGVDEITAHGLTQWDKGQKLKITLSSLPASFEVHFATKRSETAYVVDAVASGGVATVDIPNAILRNSMDAVAWIYLVDGDAGETVKTIHLPIEHRAKPADYTYDEAEVANFRETINQRMDEYLASGAILSGATLEEAAQIEQNSTDIDRNKAQIAELREFTLEQTAFEYTGTTVQVDTFGGCPLNCVTNLEPIQAGSGDPSPDNVRPITGFTGANLTRVGKNLCDPYRLQAFSAEKIRIEGDDIVIAAGKNIYGVWMDNVDFLEVGKTYTFNVKSITNYNSNYYGFRIKYLDGTYDPKDGSTGKFHFSVTIKSPVKSFLLYTGGGYESAEDVVINGLQVEENSVATEYEPHQAEAYTVDFGQTVCAGEIDWNTGVLTIDRKLISFTGDEKWGVSTSQTNAYYVGSNDNPGMLDYMVTGGSYGSVPHMLSHYKSVPYDTSMVNNTCDTFTGAAGYTVRIKDDRFTSTDAWVENVKAQYAAGTPIQVVIKITKPITIQLTPAQITAIQGMNYIHCDVGETTIGGRKDILWLTDYLLKRIRELEATVAALQ